ncbi:outer membrane protein assembly factor BamE [Solitalea canadensis]|uniref:SmpA / OmlA family n=1 Tax=Solitalea canadensis (strain ATCC 29591 / DSM 3403 / JCM 21819 / LMG 8368 / NBRC 15130 / NCIMB 12057 / USAM 9D) TaxID=929556 RepID=H8KXA5_SOLCM|nr:outer membrane protein assembly factor BamE [Solitalea canadensis]AFD08434.1 SmpA / OmlA family [Solitalea canadensis DSM 3403]
MKKVFGLLVLASIVISCSNKTADKQDFSAVKQGMTKSEVIKLVGKPEKETNLIMVEMWKYTSAGKVIVLNSDTVVQVLDDSSKMDSLKNGIHDSLDSADINQ